MVNYIHVPIETDEDATAAAAFDYLVGQFIGWTPSAGQLDVWIIMAVARMAADLKDLASDVSTDIFRYFGPLVGVTPFDEIPATALTNWVLSNNLGRTIPQGTRVGILDANLDSHEFTVSQDVVVPPGTALANNVPITSSVAGTISNAIGIAGAQEIPLDGESWITTITLVAPSSGGQDAEDDDTYLNRLADTLRTMSPRPIIPNDFAILARDIAGVGRAAALDGYNPATTTFGNERMVAVAVTDAAGVAVSGAIKAAVDTYLQSLREVNFIVNVIDPTYTTIDLQYDVNAWPGYDFPSLQTDIAAAVTAFLSPKTWGTPPGGDPHTWYNRPNVKINDLISAIGAVLGVKDVNTVTIRTGVAAYAAADIVLAGAAVLPQPGAIAGAVH